MFTFFKKLKHIVVTLRFSILSIFIVLYIISIVIIITLNYIFSAKSLLFTANQLMNRISTEIYNDFSSELKTAESDNALSAQLFQDNLINSNDYDVITRYTYVLAQKFNLVQAAYWVDDNGNFVLTKYEPDDSLTTIAYNISKHPEAKQIISRDKIGNIVKTEYSTKISDPRKRPWYLEAKQQKKQIWTDIYLFQPTPYLGITVATPVIKKNQVNSVLGLDIRLDWLSWYVGQHKISEHGLVSILTTKGDVIAYPGFDLLKDQTKLFKVTEIMNSPWFARAFEIYQKTQQESFNFYYNGENFLAIFKVIPNVARHNWVIGIVAPRDDFIGELKKTSILNLEISLIILILFLFLISTLVTKVVNPIKKLVKQTEKIKNFHLRDFKPIRSRIKEVMMLSDALTDMVLGLKSFQKYVPATLVRQLIETHENARIGGTRKQIVVLFTDIKNFTTISEKTDPDSLMVYVCEYFDALSKIIVKEKGTIDKYIGDSIMAFWGAPFEVKNPEIHAINAALKCLHKLKELDHQWLEKGKIKFNTRFGIHTGDAVVGNVGSSERMNYTALGDTINFASRLEGVNKIYGTSILISEEIFQLVNTHFVTRFIDCIVVKGKIITNNIYEVLASRKEDLSFDIDLYNENFQKGYLAYKERRWDEAIRFFSECLKIYGKDKVAPIFISRCEHYKIKPPQSSWNGSWKLHQK